LKKRRETVAFLATQEHAYEGGREGGKRSDGDDDDVVGSRFRRGHCSHTTSPLLFSSLDAI